MSENEENNINVTDRQVKFNVGYQPRTKADLLKVFFIDNLKALRGYRRVVLFSLPVIAMGLILDFLMIRIVALVLLGFIMLGTVGFYSNWRYLKKQEAYQIPQRAFVKERSLRYGDFGIVHRVLSKSGLAEEKYSWRRYRSFVIWGNQLFLLPAKKKADYFMIRSDEIGEEEFIAFAQFAGQKLPNKEITRYQELM